MVARASQLQCQPWGAAEGPAEEEQKVYLSPATLLVLPLTLIPHWLHQIRVHMKPSTLRVAVLATDRGSAEDASSGLSFSKHLFRSCSMLCALGLDSTSNVSGQTAVKCLSGTHVWCSSM